jgi:hypothetical protein
VAHGALTSMPPQQEFPIWTSVSRIVRFSCPRLNQLTDELDYRTFQVVLLR